MPSVHAKSAWPLPFETMMGCLLFAASGATIGERFNWPSASSGLQNTCSLVSQAASRRDPSSARDMLLIGQAFSGHGSRLRLENVLPLSEEESSIVSRWLPPRAAR